MILCTKFQVSSTKNFAQLEKVRPQTKEREELKKEFQMMLEIFLMSYITFTRINKMNEKMT